MSSDCAQIREQLLTMSSAEIETLAPHLDVCPDCRTLADRILLTEGLMAAHQPTPAVRTGPLLLGFAVAATLLLVSMPVLQPWLTAAWQRSLAGFTAPAEEAVDLADFEECADPVAFEPFALATDLAPADIVCLEDVATRHPNLDVRMSAASVVLVNSAREPDYDTRTVAYARRFDRAREAMTVFVRRPIDAPVVRLAAAALADQEVGPVSALRDFAGGAAPSEALLDFRSHVVVSEVVAFHRPGSLRDGFRQVEFVGPPGELRVARQSFALPASLWIEAGAFSAEWEGGAEHRVGTMVIESGLSQLDPTQALPLKEELDPCGSLGRLELDAILGKLDAEQLACVQTVSTSHADPQRREHAAQLLLLNAEDETDYFERKLTFALRFRRPRVALKLFLLHDLEHPTSRSAARVLVGLRVGADVLTDYANGGPITAEVEAWRRTLISPMNVGRVTGGELVEVQLEYADGTEVEVNHERFETPATLRTFPGFLSVSMPGEPPKDEYVEVTAETDLIRVQRRRVLIPADEEPLRPPEERAALGLHRVLLTHPRRGAVVVDDELLGTMPLRLDLAPGLHTTELPNGRRGVFIVRDTPSSQPFDVESLPEQLPDSIPDSIPD